MTVNEKIGADIFGNKMEIEIREIKTRRKNLKVRPIFVARIGNSAARGTFQMEGLIKMIKLGWEQVWAQAGHERSPPLLVIAGDIKIEAVSEAELKRVGLIRIN